MTDDREEIRARVDLVDLVGQRVALKRAGKHFKGLCPFHEDKNPSFIVDPQTGRYKCWACGESGDVFTWVMKTEHLEFGEAIRELAIRAGVTLKARGPEKPSSERETHRAAMAEALTFFREQLQLSSAAREYCDRRGLDAETLKTWEVGYAPDAGQAFANVLKRKGISLAEGKNLFLVDQDASGGYYDRFRGRLMFPIWDEKGELVAFGGRLLGDGHPKYINSSDTPLYRKSRVLYGMHRAREFFSKDRNAVLVEGYLDVIACHRSGVNGAVASLGTALSEEHARLLKRWVESVTIMYDSDEAGQKAADRAIDIIEAQGLHVRLALMSKGADPDTLFRSEGPATVKKAAESGTTPMDFRLQALELRQDSNSEPFWNEAVEILASAKSDLEAEKHLLRLATMYPGLKDVRTAQSRLRAMISQTRRIKLKKQPANPGPRPPRAEEHIPLREPLTAAEFVVMRSLHEPELQKTAWTAIVKRPELFETGAGVEIGAAVAEAFPKQAPSGPFSAWLHQIEPEPMRQLLSDLLQDFRSENLSEGRLSDSIARLEQRLEERELRKLSQQEMNPAQRQAFLERLRKRNPDTRIKTQGSEDDPFA